MQRHISSVAILAQEVSNQGAIAYYYYFCRSSNWDNYIFFDWVCAEILVTVVFTTFIIFSFVRK